MTSMTQAGLDHFERLYSASDDPWRVRESWYEQRKRALILAALPLKHYRNAYEPGCGNGELSAALAQRCARLLASDASPAAVALTEKRLSGPGEASVEQHVLPRDWPAPERGPFDLIVVSELAYYLGQDGFDQLQSRILASLAPEGTLVFCHWRHPFDDRLQGTEALHDAMTALPALAHALHHRETDFLLDIWTRAPGEAA
ncbi:SAM-dependent methyltransferase [Massilia violaceinigra]|nr:SAM-dependent methyltransferase [Massilia violaceinigra]